MLNFIREAKRITMDAIFMAKYHTPAIVPKNILQTPEINALADEFRERGCIKIESEEFIETADYLNRFYFQKIEANNNRVNEEAFRVNDRKFSILEFNKDEYRKGGMEISAYISFMDTGISPLILNEKLHSILYSYYKRQHYFRNQPRIMKVDYKGKNTIYNNNMHVDHLHQVSLILNISDITMDDTHTVYTPGSNRRSLLKQGIEMPVEKSRELVQTYKERVHFTGSKGTLYMFDTSGFHCGDYRQGNPRKILHINFTTGHYLTALHDNPDDLVRWQQKNSKPDYVKDSFNMAINHNSKV